MLLQLLHFLKDSTFHFYFLHFTLYSLLNFYSPPLGKRKCLKGRRWRMILNDFTFHFYFLHFILYSLLNVYSPLGKRKCLKRQKEDDAERLNFSLLLFTNSFSLFTFNSPLGKPKPLKGRWRRTQQFLRDSSWRRG